MYVILISGTPGTGKTSFAKKLCDRFRFLHIDLVAYIKEKRLYEGFDTKRQCVIVDIDKISQLLNQYLSELKESNYKGVVLDSHFCHVLKLAKVDLCIILKCELQELKKRLTKRGYADAKVRENLDCEIFDICLTEAQEQGYTPLIVDSTDYEKYLNKIPRNSWYVNP